MKKVTEMIHENGLSTMQPAVMQFVLTFLDDILSTSPKACNFETSSCMEGFQRMVTNHALLVYHVPNTKGIVGANSDKEYHPTQLRSHMRLACESFFQEVISRYPPMQVTCTDCSDRLDMFDLKSSASSESSDVPIALLHVRTDVNVSGDVSDTERFCFQKEEVFERTAANEYYATRVLDPLPTEELRHVFVPPPPLPLSSVV